MSNTTIIPNSLSPLALVGMQPIITISTSDISRKNGWILPNRLARWVIEDKPEIVVNKSI